MEYCTYSHDLKQTSVKAWFLLGNKVLLLMPLTQSKDTIDHTFFLHRLPKIGGAEASDRPGSFINPQDTCWFSPGWEWTIRSADTVKLRGTPERAPPMASLSLLRNHLQFTAALCPSQIVGDVTCFCSSDEQWTGFFGFWGFSNPCWSCSRVSMMRRRKKGANATEAKQSVTLCPPSLLPSAFLLLPFSSL